MSAAPPTQHEIHTLAEACRRLGIGKTTGYELVKRGEFPCRVIHLGRRMVIPRLDVDRLLTVATPPQEDGALIGGRS